MNILSDQKDECHCNNVGSRDKKDITQNTCIGLIKFNNLKEKKNSDK
tara:strand:- start:1 stop:141 length:141 start_codon:yes stop_codon:yes gene_type:complete